MSDAAGNRPVAARATFTVISVWPVPGVSAGLTAGRCLAQLDAKVSKDSIDLVLPADWLDFHPLTKADLVTESELLAAIGYSLTVNSRALG
jgi:hypothetical protein